MREHQEKLPPSVDSNNLDKQYDHFDLDEFLDNEFEGIADKINRLKVTYNGLQQIRRYVNGKES